MGFEEFSFSPQTFSGTVRLFPLPDLVLFPHVLQPLHIFERRYRDLFEEAVQQDGLIAMAMLAPGWEQDYEGRPPIFPIACLGQITSHHRLKDGSYNALLLGVSRVRMIRELSPSKSFREAEVELCEDRYPAAEMAHERTLKKKLRKALVRTLPMLPQAQEQLDQLLSADVPLGVLTDIVSYLLEIDNAAKEALLEEFDVYRRVERLLTHLAELGDPAARRKDANAPYPPRFSAN